MSHQNGVNLENRLGWSEVETSVRDESSRDERTDSEMRLDALMGHLRAMKSDRNTLIRMCRTYHLEPASVQSLREAIAADAESTIRSYSHR